MPIQPGQIVKNLIQGELVTITAVQPLGDSISLKFTGINSRKANNKVLTKVEYESLEVLAEEGSFDFKGDPERFGLFAEAERIHSAYQFDPLFAVNCSIVDPLPHQMDAVYKYLLPLPKIRFLLADDTGAGKTIMTGLLLKELMIRGIVERVLIITPGGLTKQWQEDELSVKFNLSFKLVNRSVFSSDPNIFHTTDRIVTSLDFISREDVLVALGESHWDMVIFDEAHKLSAYDYGLRVYRSKRYEAALKISQQCEHLLLLTATPHRGRTDTFQKLLQLLDEDIFATEDLASTRIREFESDGLNKFFIRRLKESMTDWEGRPLFKNRFTRTVKYELTAEEKNLYDQVTDYLSEKKKEASDAKNQHVSLALTVMQRRLVSSIYAIRNTLQRRWVALQGIVDELARNPNIWSQRHKLEGWDVENIEDFDELEDNEREALEGILSDPRKFKLFTTAQSIPDLQKETKEVKRLYELAESLYNRNQDEKKYEKLAELLRSEGVLDGEKLVIFTEHKDTLDYLDRKLKNNGYKVSTIHGGKNVDDRRQAQWEFASPETQILVATDAAGEGINLQFCRLLINWDIPWNPNRLEQRMGRIHRYGQKRDVLVFNLVANNTKEGQVLARLLSKLDVIRESMGDDRVYDVIQDVLENISLDEIMNSVLNGKRSKLDDFLDESDEEWKLKFAEKIKAQKENLAHSRVAFKDAKMLKEDSDEKRLQPIYVRLFFEKAFSFLGGKYTEVRDAIYRMDEIPPELTKVLKEDYKIIADNLRQIQYCFDKKVFLEYQNLPDLGRVYYINPGNPLFDSLVHVIRNTCRADMLKGTILISADDKEEFLAFFVKSQITDERPRKRDDFLADERLYLIYQKPDGTYLKTSPAKFLDLKTPATFSKPIEPPSVISKDSVREWVFINLTQPQFAETRAHVSADAAKRREYLETGFMHVIVDIDSEINELQGKIFSGSQKDQEKLQKKIERKKELLIKKQERLQTLELMTKLSPREPEILGCAFVIPLTKLEYESHYGMSRDDEAEAIAMKTAMDYERSQKRMPEDLGKENLGYDIRSISVEGIKRYIEVKGRSVDGGVLLSENEMNRLAQLGDSAWLYIVINCKSDPELFHFQNPAVTLKFDLKTKGIQYFLPMAEWKAKTIG